MKYKNKKVSDLIAIFLKEKKIKHVFGIIGSANSHIFDSIKKLKQKIVVTFHGADIQKDENILYGYRFDKKYEDFLGETIHFYDKVFAISDDIIKELNFFNFPKEKIVKIPNSIEIKKIVDVGNNKFNPKILKFSNKKKKFNEKKNKIISKNFSYKPKI